MRDALLAVLASSLLLVLLEQRLPSDQRGAVEILVARALPLWLLTVVALALTISWSARGGGMSLPATRYRVAWVVLGGELGLAVLGVLGDVVPAQ